MKFAVVSLALGVAFTGCATAKSAAGSPFQDGVSPIPEAQRPMFAVCDYSSTNFPEYDWDIWSDCKGFDTIEHKSFFKPIDIQTAMAQDEGRFESQQKAEDSSGQVTLAGEQGTRTQVTYSNADSGPHRTLIYYLFGQEYYYCDVNRWTEPNEDYRLRTEAEYGPELKNCDAAVAALHEVVRAAKRP